MLEKLLFGYDDIREASLAAFGLLVLRIGVGIRGDIDIDTGMNAEGLWLHLHTLHARDPLPDDRPVISWLFWAREALETCSTIEMTTSGRTAYVAGNSSMAGYSGAQWAGGSSWVPN